MDAIYNAVVKGPTLELRVRPAIGVWSAAQLLLTAVTAQSAFL